MEMGFNIPQCQYQKEWKNVDSNNSVFVSSRRIQAGKKEMEQDFHILQNIATQ